MKYWFILFLLSIPIVSGSQSLSAGFFNGAGFSDIHSYDDANRWRPVSGPLTGVFLKYSFSPVFSVGTEVNYLKQVYYHVSDGYYAYPEPMPYSSIAPTYYTDYKEQLSYDFLRFPLYLTLSTPTRLQLSISAGIFISLQTRHDYYGFGYYADNEPPRHDNGLLYAMSLSYPISESFRFYATGRYVIGHKRFVAINNNRTGASEIAAGISYNLFSTKKKNTVQKSETDSAMKRFLILPEAGITFSWVRQSISPEHYKTKSAGSAGIKIEYRLDKYISLVTGLSFDRKGYRLDDSSTSHFRHVKTNYPAEKMNTRVDIDYAVIPLMLKIRGASAIRIYVEAGIYAGFKLNARVTGKAESESFTYYDYYKRETDVNEDIEGYVRNFEIGWTSGAGIEFPLKNGSWVYAGANYQGGNKIITPNNRIDYFEYDNELRNASFKIQAGLIIPLKTSINNQ